MTKGQLIDMLKDFPDIMEIRVGEKEDDGSFIINGACKFHGDDFITIEPGSYVEGNENVE